MGGVKGVKAMRTGAPRDITPLLTYGYQVKIGEYISRGFELLLPNIALFIVYELIVFVALFLLALPILLIFSIPVIGFLLATPLLIIVSALSIVMNSGFYLVALRIVENEPIAFSNFFDGFRRFMDYSLLGIIRSYITSIGFYFCILPGFYLSLAYSFDILAMSDQEIDFWPAMEMSRQLVTKNFFPMFGFLLLLGLINLGGLLLCGLGLLLTIPLTYCAMTVAYMDIMNQGSNPINSTF